MALEQTKRSTFSVTLDKRKQLLDSQQVGKKCIVFTKMATATTGKSDITVSRYTDLLDEPVTHLLAPIKGYQKEKLVSLKDAIAPISHLFEDIDPYVYVAWHNCANPKDGLSQDESASIYLYTMEFDSETSFYHVLNYKLRSEDRRSLQPWFLYLKLFLTALYKLPSRVQHVWRGVRGVNLSDRYLDGTEIVFELF